MNKHNSTFKAAMLFSIAFALTFTSCKTSSSITKRKSEVGNITTVAYFNDSKDSLIIPGDWSLSSENKLTNQKFFRNADSLLLAITKNPVQKYGFFVAGMNDATFTEAFYRWEASHYQKIGYDVRTLQESAKQDYVLWSAKGKDIDAILLYGAKKGFGYNISMLERQKLTEVQVTSFLIQTFKQNN